MADRNPSFFGEVLPTADTSVEAFSADELARIRARLIERDIHRASAAWPETRRFQTIYPRMPEDRASGIRVRRAEQRHGQQP